MTQIEKTAKALDKAINLFGLRKFGLKLNVTYQAVYGWKTRGMPRTEFTCETSYSQQIEAMTAGKVKVEDLLGHRPACLKK